MKEDLDLFLLALIQQGITTAYRMQAAAGISQGSSLQVLKRLLERKFIRMSEEGPRRRTEFLLTLAGERWLIRGCAALADAEPTGDFDSILRKALLVAFIEKNLKKANQLLRAAVAQRLSRDAEMPAAPLGTADMGQLYLRLRETQAAAISNTEVDVLKRAMADLACRSKRKG